ncbi:Outer membrane protein TolC [Desulfacinum infernum DSM 9756]|uniref:Outer membrane protein TolC n=1 Tax=Desulfacinum infernum DSM 9756 TaxID=1121391 RepID=A0A1M4TXT1_9BACT|nr:TolC family protein [Desulfacinum infernum]SHE49242.1 Outer membrane protein TolC [Desulfacinum infernum DSM 9756]
MPIFRVFALVLTLLLGLAGPGRAASEAWDLPACVERALAENPQIRDLELGVRAAGEEIAKSRAAFFPSLDLESSYTRTGEPQRIVPAHANNEPGAFDRDLLDTAVTARLALFEGGRRWAQVRIAELGKDLAVSRFESGRRDVVLNVASAYYKILQLDRVLEATRGSRRALAAQEELVRHQLDVGRAAPVDHMKIRVRVASLDQKISSLEADRRVLLVFLGRLMGLDLKGRADFDIAGALETPDLKLPTVEEGLAEAMGARPEHRTAALALEQARQAVRAARADVFPQIQAFGRYGLRNGLPYDQDGPSGAMDHEDTWAAGIRATLPLFRGGAVRASIRQARLREKQARERLRAVDLQIREDVERAHARLKDSAERLRVTRTSVAVAEETLRIEQDKYQAGKNTINDVLDAQAALLQAQVEYSQAQVDAQLALLEWRGAVGEDLTRLARGK